MKVTFELPDSSEAAQSYNDEYLAFLWHAAQHNPAPISDQMAGDAVEWIGHEIIRRWLKNISPPMWKHQGRHHFWSILVEHGKWLPVNGNENDRQWTPNPTENKESPK